MKELDFNTENSVKVVKAMVRGLVEEYFALKSLVNSLTDGLKAWQRQRTCLSTF